MITEYIRKCFQHKKFLTIITEFIRKRFQRKVVFYADYRIYAETLSSGYIRKRFRHKFVFSDDYRIYKETFLEQSCVVRRILKIYGNIFGIILYFLMINENIRNRLRLKVVFSDDKLICTRKTKLWFTMITEYIRKRFWYKVVVYDDY